MTRFATLTIVIVDRDESEVCRTVPRFDCKRACPVPKSKEDAPLKE